MSQAMNMDSLLEDTITVMPACKLGKSSFSNKSLMSVYYYPSCIEFAATKELCHHSLYNWIVYPMNNFLRKRLVRNPFFLLAVDFFLKKKFAEELGQA